MKKVLNSIFIIIVILRITVITSKLLNQSQATPLYNKGSGKFGCRSDSGSQHWKCDSPDRYCGCERCSGSFYAITGQRKFDNKPEMQCKYCDDIGEHLCSECNVGGCKKCSSSATWIQRGNTSSGNCWSRSQCRIYICVRRGLSKDECATDSKIKDIKTCKDSKDGYPSIGSCYTKYKNPSQNGIRCLWDSEIKWTEKNGVGTTGNKRYTSSNFMADWRKDIYKGWRA